MKGFKNSSKTIPGHHFASGGIVPGGSSMPGVRMNTPSVRPVMPRPHVMPSGRPFGMKTAKKLAKGGRVGGSLERPVPYSQVESEHPRKAARPGYAKGGRRIAKAEGGKVCDAPGMRKVADKEISKHVAAPKPTGHGIKGGLRAFSRAPLFGKD